METNAKFTVYGVERLEPADLTWRQDADILAQMDVVRVRGGVVFNIPADDLAALVLAGAVVVTLPDDDE